MVAVPMVTVHLHIIDFCWINKTRNPGTIIVIDDISKCTFLIVQYLNGYRSYHNNGVRYIN